MMGLYTTLPDELKEVDVIIAGGGTSGCTVAGRLAEADPSLKILLVETGQNNSNVPSVAHPAIFLHNLAPTSTSVICYKANKSGHLNDREVIVPAGGILGGGSSVNFMCYTRAQREDYDDWNMPGWSTNELLPFMKKFEGYSGNGSRERHGTSGPVKISNGRFRLGAAESDVLRAAQDVGYRTVTDLQDLDSCNAFERWLRYICPDGKRQDAAHAYLHPKLVSGRFPNLHVLVETKVVRVLFDGTRASGLECIPNTNYQSSSGPTAKMIIKAKKMVVLSCGALGTPLVLERSGVGSAKVLKTASVPVVADVAGVGENFQDHHLMIYTYKSALGPEETLDALISGRKSIQQALETQDPKLGWNGCDVLGKVRPTDAEAEALGPAFQKAWQEDFKSRPNRPIMLLGLLNGYFGDRTPKVGISFDGQYNSVAAYTAYPYSRGHIHITGPSPEHAPDFDIGIYGDAYGVDIKKHLWAYKKQREIVRRTAQYRGEVPQDHPPFSPDSPAACVDLAAPLGGDGSAIKDILYSAEDDAVIEQYLRNKIASTWHCLGTTKMAPREEGGVVDEMLSVYGVSGLKVVDLSICPTNVAANTNSTAFMVGEKGADIIVRELGLKKRTNWYGSVIEMVRWVLGLSGRPN